MNSYVEFTIRSMRKNLDIAEDNLRKIREYIDRLQHGQPPLWVRFVPGLAWWSWNRDARVCIRDAKETRRRIRIYKRVESELRLGELSTAIEALAEFCPQAESQRDLVRRIRRDRYLLPLQAVFRSPDVLRENMLRLRENLIKIQRESMT